MHGMCACCSAGGCYTNVGAWYTELRIYTTLSSVHHLAEVGRHMELRTYLYSTLSLICKVAVRQIKYDGCKAECTILRVNSLPLSPALPLHLITHNTVIPFTVGIVQFSSLGTQCCMHHQKNTAELLCRVMIS